MPQRLKQRQTKIQEKRKHTPWREFIQEICSWRPLTLYKQGDTITAFPATNRLQPVIHRSDFEENIDTLLIQKDFYTGDFFQNLFEHWNSFSFPSVCHYGTNSDSDFSDLVHYSKNAYLSGSVTVNSENVLYSYMVRTGRDIHSSVQVIDNSEQVYMSSYVYKGYKVFYSKYINNCSDIWFSTNLVGCKNCINCHGLENQSYMIENTQYSKEEYVKKMRETLNLKVDFVGWHQKINLQKGMNHVSKKSTGEYLINCENVDTGFACLNVKNGRNLFIVGSELGNERMYDFFTGGAGESHDYYGVVNSGLNNHIYCCNLIGESSQTYYSMNLLGCSYCLGCFGLRNKSYCIFNKQYTKEERYDKVDEIFTQMEQNGTLGDFFPGSMNPFYFNDTAAYLIDDSFTKEEVEAKGYLRRDEKIAVDIPEGMEVVKTSELGEYEGRQDSNGELYPATQTPTPEGTPSPSQGTTSDSFSRYINPEILKKVIQDEEGNVYRIVKMEYDFLMKHGLPLPRLHWLDRLKMNFKID